MKKSLFASVMTFLTVSNVAMANTASASALGSGSGITSSSVSSAISGSGGNSSSGSDIRVSPSSIECRTEDGFYGVSVGPAINQPQSTTTHLPRRIFIRKSLPQLDGSLDVTQKSKVVSLSTGVCVTGKEKIMCVSDQVNLTINLSKKLAAGRAIFIQKNILSKRQIVLELACIQAL